MSDVITRVHTDPTERKYIFERVQDIEPIIEHNKQLQSMPQRSDWGRHVWSLPNVIYERLFNEYNEGRLTPDLKMFGNPEFDEYCHRRMQDPDMKAFRTDNKSNPFFMGWGK
jgi:hypothetical protein